MSLQFPSMLLKNSPALVATAGVSILLGLPALEAAAASSTVSLAVLKGANCLAFLVNAASVSVPGRMDGQKAVIPAKSRDNINHKNNTGTGTTSTTEEGTPLVAGAGNTAGETDTETDTDTPSVYGARSLVSPSGWAFAIWAPIYLGEAAFCTAQLFAAESSALASVLPNVTGSFVAANLIQSLWCASFRPSYHTDSHGWQKYVSVGMLAGTAVSLSHVHNVAISPEAMSLGWYFLPLTMHFGWTTAATLVNLNGALAEDQLDSFLIAAGHASAITATTLGVGITLAQASPVYGFTIAWALAACANEAAKKVNGGSSSSRVVEAVGAYQKGATRQKMLCWAGSAACVAASLFQIVS
jgi:hypothetical protein